MKKRFKKSNSKSKLAHWILHPLRVECQWNVSLEEFKRGMSLRNAIERVFAATLAIGLMANVMANDRIVLIM